MLRIKLYKLKIYEKKWKTRREFVYSGARGYALNVYPRAVVRAAEIHHFKFDIDIGNDKL